MGEDTLFDAGDEHDVELEPLRRVRRQQRDALLALLVAVEIRDQRDLIEVELELAEPTALDASAEAYLAELAALDVPGFLDDPAPLVSFDSFGDSALMINLRAFISSIDYRIAVNTSLHKAINSRFAEAGIVIAFPQRHLHLEAPSPLRIRVEDDRALASPEV